MNINNQIIPNQNKNLSFQSKSKEKKINHSHLFRNTILATSIGGGYGFISRYLKAEKYQNTINKRFDKLIKDGYLKEAKTTNTARKYFSSKKLYIASGTAKWATITASLYLLYRGIKHLISRS